MTQQRTFPENVSSPTSQRDELAEILFAGRRHTIGETVNDILLAGYSKPRPITTADELEALPNESVIRDFAGDVAEKRGGVWCSYETAPMSDSRMAKYLPGVVLYEPVKP